MTGGLVVLAATVWVAWRVRLQPRSLSWPLFVGGLGLMIGAPILMGARYSDPYRGSLFWPHLLAVLAFCGLLLAVGALTRALSR